MKAGPQSWQHLLQWLSLINWFTLLIFLCDCLFCCFNLLFAQMLLLASLLELLLLLLSSPLFRVCPSLSFLTYFSAPTVSLRSQLLLLVLSLQSCSLTILKHPLDLWVLSKNSTYTRDFRAFNSPSTHSPRLYPDSLHCESDRRTLCLWLKG